MTEKYIVVNASSRHYRFLVNIVGSQPYFSTRVNIAKAYTCRELAEYAAQKCREFTGRRWRVVDVSEPTQEEVKEC